MSRIKLLEKHPTMEKLEKVFALCDELGISFDFDGPYKTIISDKEFPGVDFEFIDSDSNEKVAYLPATFDFKVVYEKE